MDSTKLINPEYYKDAPFESWELNKHLGYLLGTACKYIYRMDGKGQRGKDLRKALWFVEKAIEEAMVVHDMLDQMDKHDPRWPVLKSALNSTYNLCALNDMLNDIKDLLYEEGPPVRSEGPAGVPQEDLSQQDS